MVHQHLVKFLSKRVARVRLGLMVTYVKECVRNECVPQAPQLYRAETRGYALHAANGQSTQQRHGGSEMSMRQWRNGLARDVPGQSQVSKWLNS
jgi:hypothetical protein